MHDQSKSRNGVIRSTLYPQNDYIQLIFNGTGTTKISFMSHEKPMKPSSHKLFKMLRKILLIGLMYCISFNCDVVIVAYRLC